ncbi:hypothetical protein H7100_00875 [Candidatus Saccharibacteria bacterium]|nr:hypothetical protein [Candidatus Saccharibacteria bacterium]
MPHIKGGLDSFIEPLKTQIVRRALRNGWPMDQIQFAEDYIDAINRGVPEGHNQIAHPIGLEQKYARVVRDSIKAKKKNRPRTTPQTSS